MKNVIVAISILAVSSLFITACGDNIVGSCMVESMINGVKGCNEFSNNRITPESAEEACLAGSRTDEDGNAIMVSTYSSKGCPMDGLVGICTANYGKGNSSTYYYNADKEDLIRSCEYNDGFWIGP